MFIKEIKKKNTGKGKTFYQYQLTRAARLNGKARHISVLYLGSHELLQDKGNRKIVTRILEEMIHRQGILSGEGQRQASGELLRLCEILYEKYQVKYQDSEPEGQPVFHSAARYEQVDIDSMRVSHTKEIGAEWLCYNTTRQLGLDVYLRKAGWDEPSIDLALISIISRAVLAASEHKTADWLDKNSALLELFAEDLSVSRYQLYKMASRLHEIKDHLLNYLYEQAVDLFSLDDKIVIFDLTNTYFEGRKVHSKKARFGRSKEKRNDCRLLVMGAVVNQYGFLKASRIYEGNKADSDTLKDIITQMNSSIGPGQTRSVVIDAGIATEENLEWLRHESIPYVCVSRKKLKDYRAQVQEEVVSITDKRKNKIELKSINDENTGEQWLYVKSEQKAKKEHSMTNKLEQRFVQELETAKAGIHKKGGTKKLEKVWERIGRIKERSQTVHQRYKIKVAGKDEKATDITWTSKEDVPLKSEGVYFIRTNYPVKDEAALWGIYNTIREVESTFRCLKTDLNLRPVYHQKDQYMEAHLSLGLIAYQVVAAIRHQLRQNNIHMDWRNIVRILNTQKLVTVEQQAPTKTIAMRTCSQPIQEVSDIYKATGIPHIPLKKRKYVVYH